jgi:microcompartment protein CcmL/EutN
VAKSRDSFVVKPVGATGPCIALVELASIATGIETVDALLKQAEVQLLLCRAVTPGKYVILFTGPVDDVMSALRRAVEVGGDVLIDRLFIPNIEPTLLALVKRAVSGPSGTIAVADELGADELGVDELGADELVADDVESTDLGAGERADRGATTGALSGPAGAGQSEQAGAGAALSLDALGMIETLSIASTLRAGDLASKLASLTLVSLELARGIGGKSYLTFTGEVSDVEAGVHVGAADADAAGLLVRRLVIPRPHEELLEVLRGGPNR